MNKETSIKRLGLLRKRLLAIHRDKAPDVGFNMDLWFRASAYNISPRLEIDPAGRCEVVISTECGKSACGTTACALGHAALMPQFQRLGLTLNTIISGLDAEGTVWYRGREGVGAAVVFFGISIEQAGYLFTGSPGTANDVALRVQEIIDRRRKNDLTSPDTFAYA